ncbi:MAG: CD225/dispanin family protein [Actinomycetota bacterium]|nr:CD225/dispanin family protein [Actinomycetota bacterium]
MYPSQSPSTPHLPSMMAPPMPPMSPRVTAPMPATNAGWAVAAMIFFWPLAFAAFAHSSKVTGLWLSGDHAAAQDAADRAKRLGKISLLLWAILSVAFIVLYVAMIAEIISSARSVSYY